MTLVAVVAMSITANAQSVYVSTGDGAVAYHKSKSCSYLANSKDVKSVSTSEAKKMGRHECTRCYGTAAATKKTTTAKKTTSGIPTAPTPPTALITTVSSDKEATARCNATASSKYSANLDPSTAKNDILKRGRKTQRFPPLLFINPNRSLGTIQISSRHISNQLVKTESAYKYDSCFYHCRA